MRFPEVSDREDPNQQLDLPPGETPQFFAFGHRQLVERLERAHPSPVSLTAQQLSDGHRLRLGWQTEQYLGHITLAAGDAALEFCARVADTVRLLKRDEASILRREELDRYGHRKSDLPCWLEDNTSGAGFRRTRLRLVQNYV